MSEMFLAPNSFFYWRSQLEIAAFVHELRLLQIVVHRTMLEDNQRYQRQTYSTAATAVSRQDPLIFHLVHFVTEDLSGGHFANFQPNVEQVD